MPRDPITKQYSVPDGTDGVPDVTISSQKYNAFIHDIEFYMNDPLPVVAGGTGASTAEQARINLGVPAASGGTITGGTITNTTITNATTLSVTGATTLQNTLNVTGLATVGGLTSAGDVRTYRPGTPTTGAYFFGSAPQDTYLYFNGTSFALNGGSLGVNGAISANGAIGATGSIGANGDVNAGGVLHALSGTVQFGGGAPVGFYTDGSNVAIRSPGSSGVTYFQSANGGTNYGNIGPTGFATSGNLDASGNSIISGNLTTNSALITTRANGGLPNEGLIYFGAPANSKYLHYNGAFNFNGAPVNVSSLAAVTVATSGDVVASGNVYGSTITGSTWIHSTATINADTGLHTGGNLHVGNFVYGGKGYNTRAGADGANGGNIFNIMHTTGSPHLWIDNTDFGSIAFTSDYRVKKDVLALTSTWDRVKALRPISYTQAEYTPANQPPPPPPPHDSRGGTIPAPAVSEAIPPMFVADDIERWGFIAHELQATLVPSAANGVKDDPVNIQAPNPWTVIAALTSALQEAMARIEALEAAT